MFLLIAGGSNKGKKLLLPRMPCDPGVDDFPVPGFEIIQFLIRFCFTITTTKAQEQFFSNAIVIGLLTECFYMINVTFICQELRNLSIFCSILNEMMILQLR